MEIATSKDTGLFPIKLRKLSNGSVEGTLPCGYTATWPSYASNRPTRRNRTVMLNCYRWLAVWESTTSQA